MRRRLRYFWGKLPRAFYWTLGGAIAFAGAIVARLLAERMPEYRVAIWLVGAIAIFFGLAVLSLGTKARLRGQDDEGKEGVKLRVGAGEGNRTLV